MALSVKNLKALPVGKLTGIITAASIAEVDYKQGKGPEKALIVVIQPKNPADGIYNPQSINFTPEVNPLSNAGQLLKRLGMEPNYNSEKSFEESELCGVEVSFNVKQDGMFTRIVKDSITAL